jgi:hypothetical protein
MWLTTLCKEFFMSDTNIVKSTLDVHPRGSAASVENDLNLPEGKSIAELLDEQKENSSENSKEKEDQEIIEE